MAAVTTPAVDWDPTDFEGKEQRDREVLQRAIAVGLEERNDLVWLLSGRRGRRRVRRLLREANFRVESDLVSSVLDRHHGTMCFKEGHRTQALQMIWPIMRLLASGELPFESFKKLMTETDE